MFKRVLSLLICLSLAFPAWATQDFLLNDIVIEGNKRVQSVDVLNSMAIKPGQTVTPADIDAAMADVYRMERFSDIASEITTDSGVTVLTLKVVERPWCVISVLRGTKN